MNETARIKIETRTSTSKGANHLLRRNGYLPGNITGKGIGSVPVAIKKDELRKAINKFGRNSVYRLEISDEKAYTVMVKEIQYSSIANEYYHVDFQQVSLSEKVKTDVEIKYIGVELLESKRLLVNRQMDTILVEGLPQNVPDSIEIDISNLRVDESIKISDLKLPEGIITEMDPTQVVVSVHPPKAQEQETIETEKA